MTITGIRARNKNNLLGGINQLLGAGIRQKFLVKILGRSLGPALGSRGIVLNCAPEPHPLWGFPFCWFNKNAKIYSRPFKFPAKPAHFHLGVTIPGTQTDKSCSPIPGPGRELSSLCSHQSSWGRGRAEEHP